MIARKADPYLDLAVIDSRAARVNQAVVALLCLAAFATGLWPLLALAALHLALTLWLGRRWCLPFLVYFAWLQPWLGEGPLEDARPARFANLVGAIALGAASLAHLLGFSSAGWALGLLVAGLALLSATTGFCAGCEMYRLIAPARGIRHRAVEHIDLAGLGAPEGAEVIVEFTHPLCADCQDLDRRLEGQAHPVLRVDVSRRPDLARKYGISVVPLAYRVRPDGAVLGRVRA
jgi:uncharacterized protein DUF4395